MALDLRIGKKITPLCDPLKDGFRPERRKGPSFSGPLAKKNPPLTKYLKQNSSYAVYSGKQKKDSRETQGKHGDIVIPYIYLFRKI